MNSLPCPADHTVPQVLDPTPPQIAAMGTEALPKPRSDSVLKTLPEERQDQIAEFAHNHSVRETAAWLSDSGTSTSKSSVGEFLTWYHIRQTLARNETAIATLAAELAKEDATLTADRLHEVGHIFFASLAVQKQDHKAWYMAEQIAIRTARLQLDTRKYDDELKAQREARTAKDRVDASQAGLTPEARHKIEEENHIL